MFKITEYTIEEIADPFKILEGNRYELLLDLEVEEDDELFHDVGVRLRIVFAVEEEVGRIIRYEFQTGDTGKYIDFEMEEDEEAMVLTFCNENYKNNK